VIIGITSTWGVVSSLPVSGREARAGKKIVEKGSFSPFFWNLAEPKLVLV
jgi:hypothetical protein